MTLLQTVVVGAGGQARLEFNSISGAHTDLMLKLSLRGNRTEPLERFRLVFNQDQSNSYSYRVGIGTGTSTFAEGITTNGVISYAANAATSTAGSFSNSTHYVPSYAFNGAAKVVTSMGAYEQNAVGSWIETSNGLWFQTVPITSVWIVPDIGTGWLQHTTASLYGITAGSDGVTQAS